MRPQLAPDPNPIKPTYTPPPDACDAHCHIFGPGDEFPYAPNRTYTPPDAGKKRLRALHDHLGFSRAVLVQASCHGLDNSAMVDAMEWSKGAWRGVAMVNEKVEDRELQRLNTAGARGVRFNFVAHLGGAPDLARVNAVIDRLPALGWHVELHLDAHDIATYRDFLDKLPVPFIIDHMGRVEAKLGLEQPAFKLLLDLMETNDRAWVKVSGAERVSSGGRPFRDAIPFGRALAEAAPTRVLWGTDFPHPNVKEMPNDGESVDLFAEMIRDEALRRQILVDNPTTLYWS